MTKGDANNTEDQALVPAENLGRNLSAQSCRTWQCSHVFADHTGNDTLCDLSDPFDGCLSDTGFCRRRNERSEKKAADALRTELETLRAEKEKHI